MLCLRVSQQADQARIPVELRADCGQCTPCPGIQGSADQEGDITPNDRFAQGGCDGGCDGGIKGGGGGATASGTDTPTLMATGAAETTVMPRLVERADTGWATNALATSATAVLLPKPASGMVRVAATLTLAAETRTPSMQFGS